MLRYWRNMKDIWWEIENEELKTNTICVHVPLKKIPELIMFKIFCLRCDWSQTTWLVFQTTLPLLFDPTHISRGGVGSSRYLLIMIAAKFAKIYPIKLPHFFYLQKYIKKAFFVQYFTIFVNNDIHDLRCPWKHSIFHMSLQNSFCISELSHSWVLWLPDGKSPQDLLHLKSRA